MKRCRWERCLLAVGGYLGFSAERDAAGTLPQVLMGWGPGQNGTLPVHCQLPLMRHVHSAEALSRQRPRAAGENHAHWWCCGVQCRTKHCRCSVLGADSSAVVAGPDPAGASLQLQVGWGSVQNGTLSVHCQVPLIRHVQGAEAVPRLRPRAAGGMDAFVAAGGMGFSAEQNTAGFPDFNPLSLS